MSLPVFILCRDRLGCLQRLYAWLQSARGVERVICIDDDSTYEPLRQWYSDNRIETVHTKDRPAGAALDAVAYWCEASKHTGPVVVTDCDIVPTGPRGWTIEMLHDIYKLWPGPGRVGLGLDVWNIPDHYPWRRQARFTEVAFWVRRIKSLEGWKVDFYLGDIDTTFAVMDPVRDRHVPPLRCLRLGEPYVAQHTTWWLDPANLPTDEAHYMARTGHKGWSFGYGHTPEAHAGPWQPREWMSPVEIRLAQALLADWGERDV